MQRAGQFCGRHRATFEKYASHSGAGLTQTHHSIIRVDGAHNFVRAYRLGGFHNTIVAYFADRANPGVQTPLGTETNTMLAMKTAPIRYSAESVSRLLNFTDAIVAIAVTLMVLPLVDIESPGPGETVWEVLGQNWGQILAFFLSFVITLVFWRRHHRFLDGLKGIDAGLMFISLVWLGLIVLFQVPTKLLGNDQNPNDGSATLYLAYLAVLGFATMSIPMYVRRHPALLENTPNWTARNETWGLITYTYVALTAVASIWLGQSALYLLGGLFIIGRLEAVDSKRHQTAP